jgi:TolA-binding protein
VVLLTVLAVPPGGAGSMTEDERRARELADEILAAGDKVPFNLRAQALAVKGLHTRAVMTYAEGLRGHLPPALANGLMAILQSHPSLRRPEGTDVPDPVEADKHYAVGLNRFFAEDYAGAEKELAEAVRLYGRDARYFYFLGLARLHQGKQRGAEADFAEGARLEKFDLPPRAAVSRSLERIQGRVRLLLNEVREQR